MNSKRFLLWATLISLPLVARGQPYVIDWFTIDGGGGTSTGGVYSISGTIGQPDAGRLTGASYTLDGGFWGFVGVIQTPDAPLLRVERSGPSVRVFWPVPATGFVLDETLTLNGPPSLWVPVAFPYQTNATHISITVAPAAGNRFYRLRKP